MQRISELARLPDGWLDGQGKAVTPEAQASMLAVLDGEGGVGTGAFVYPTEEGGLALEFDRSGWGFSVEALPAGGLEFYGVKYDFPDQVEPVRLPGPSAVAVAIAAALA